MVTGLRVEAQRPESISSMGGYTPEGELFDTFRTLAKTVRNFYTQIFQYWDCPIAISNRYTECANRLIRESNMKGRGCSFETLRGRSLYCKTNLLNIINSVGISIGPNPRRRRVVHHRGRKGERRGRRMGAFPEPEYEVDEVTGKNTRLTVNLWLKQKHGSSSFQPTILFEVRGDSYLPRTAIQPKILHTRFYREGHLDKRWTFRHRQRCRGLTRWPKPLYGSME